MAIASGASIEAVLTLNASGFESSLSSATTSVKTFIGQVNSSTTNVQAFSSAVSGLINALSTANADFTQFNNHAKGIEAFNKFANGVKALATAIDTLGRESNETSVGMERVREIITSLEGTFGVTEVKITGVSNALRKLVQDENSVKASSDQMKASFSQAQQTLATLSNAVQPLAKVQQQMELMKAEFERARTGMLEFANYGVQAFNQVDATSNKLKSQVNSMNMEFERSKAQLMEFARYGLVAFNEFATGEQKASASTKQLNSSINQTTSSIQRQATANRTATASTNQLTSATNKLRSAFNSLKMIGTMVGSMLAYNFAHKLLVATGETIHAKSEMEGYFKMLNFGQNDINHFNHALDQTVAQFQRVNKYSLGETISSIGVEFNLTTKEMEKAMKVTSMITSEYLRAGRNANEASLAVKDVLQGQFQRLSRETGVKGEQLKEAGWSGDTTDVLGLMEALEKVGKSRNWDVFAEKANSLNDIITILQNRFGEWSADMVYTVQPTIVSAFNTIMSVGSAMGNVLSGMWKWLNGDGIANQVVKWTAIATAIGTVTTALVSYRTGANLAQLAQMGLRGSIMATIFGLKAEEVATYGSRNALIAKITSLKAEQVAEMGSARAIATKLLGLDAELVKNNGLKGAIMSTVLARKLEEAEMQGATVAQKAKIATDHMEEVSNMGTLRTIMAKIAGVNMETFAEKGLIVALAERVSASLPYVSALEAEKVAEMSTAEAGLFLTASLAPLIAILAGLAVGLYALIKPLQDASDGMAKFNNILNNGESIVKEHRKSYESLNSSYNKANDELNNLTKGTNEYIRKEQEVNALHKDAETANDNLINSYKAYQRTVSANAKYEEASTNIRIHAQTRLKDAYIKAGISSAKASELASHELREANEGAEQLRKTLQMLKYEADRSSAKQESIIGKLDAYGISDEQIEKYGENLANAQDKISEGMEAFMTSDDLMERVQGWFTIQQGRLEEWWTEFNALFEIRDWDGMRDAMFERLNYLLTGFGAFDWITPLKKAIGEKGIVGVIMDALFGEGDSDGALDIIWSWADSMILTPIADWLNWFMQDPFTNFDITMDSFSLALGKFLFGNDSESLRDITSEWFNNNVINPIVEWLNWFIEDPASHFDVVMNDASLWVAKLLFGSDTNTNLRDMFSMWVDTNIVQPLGQSLWTGITSIPLVGDIIQLLATITGATPSAHEKGNYLGTSFGNALVSVVRNIPLLGNILQLLGIIPQANPTASSNGQGVGSAIKTGFKNGILGMADIIRNEIGHIIDAIGNKIEEARNKAHELGNAIVSGVRNAIDPGSPGIIARAIIGNEFGTYIPQVITDNGDLAYSSAQYYGEQIKSGISSVNTDSLSMDTAVANYETDAQNIAMSSQMMGTETSTAFNDMSLAVNNSTAMMSSNVGTTYSQMQQKQTSSLQSMKTQNQTAYQEMYLKSHQSLVQMRDSTSNITQQMISAWTHMKTQLVATANQLRSESTNHFNRLSETIGSFYRKIQNPSNWGAGGGSSIGVRGARNPSVGRSIASGIRTRGATHHGAGGTASPYMTNSKTMSLRQLKSMICPSGNCDIFDGYDLNERVNVSDFLSQVGGEHGFGWSGWNSRHYNYIKDKSDQWDMKSPRINLAGGIDTNTNFKVGDFENGTPQISFDSFRGMAEAIFTAIPYRFYYDSAWKGSWLGALQAGACNCSDGADALVAFANACGFSGYKQHGTWRNSNGQTFGHFWAVINGHKMDTTGWQNQRNWTPSNSAGSPVVRRANPSYSNNTSEGRTFNLTVNINEPVYGVDDLENHIIEASKKAMREEFNDPFTVAL